MTVPHYPDAVPAARLVLCGLDGPAVLTGRNVGAVAAALDAAYFAGVGAGMRRATDQWTH